MWRNYLTVGIRALAKNKTYAFINIFGLALGLAACLLILLYVRYETSYDKWLPDADRVFQVQTHYDWNDRDEELHMQSASYVVGPTLKKDFPQIEKVLYVTFGNPVLLRNGEAFPVEQFVLADGLFFDVLRFPLLKGDPNSALAQVGSVVLTESEARKYFGGVDAMGKTLSLASGGKTQDYRITGIAKDPPKNSNIPFKMVARFDPQTHYADTPDFLTSWGWEAGGIYLKLKAGADIEGIRAGLPAWEKRNIPDQNNGGIRSNPGEEQDWTLVSLPDVHLSGVPGPVSGIEPKTIATIAIVALLVLAMACVNFVNLATARATRRAREVGLRKVLGAKRSDLIVQFLGESIVLVFIATLIALAFVELLLPSMAAFLDADLRLSYWGAEGILIPSLLLALIVGAAGGLYPAFYLSHFQPAQVLKANKSAAEPAGSGRLRNALVVAQFAVSIGLIVCTAVVYRQTIFLLTADPGYERNGLIQIEETGREEVEPLADALRREIEKVEGVTSVGLTNLGIATDLNMLRSISMPGGGAPRDIGSYAVGPDFFQTMGMRFIAGRGFDDTRPGDDGRLSFPDNPAAAAAVASRGVNAVMSEMAVKRLGFSNASEAVGKQVHYGSDRIPVTIIGVIQDPRLRSARTELGPLMFRQSPSETQWMVVRHENADPSVVRQRIAAVWKKFVPQVPFQARFSEDIVADLYTAEEARGVLFAGFALLAILIACLGLFGLAAFTVERRTKEIGIRKVLGARIRDIVQLLVWQFSKPVIIANLIAWPVAWWVMGDWLNSFDAPVDLGPGPFVLAGILALAIAIGTIAGHAIRVARTNPIHALRYE
jgi:putative ABC transport system permease protein